MKYLSAVCCKNTIRCKSLLIVFAHLGTVICINACNLFTYMCRIFQAQSRWEREKRRAKRPLLLVNPWEFPLFFIFSMYVSVCWWKFCFNQFVLYLYPQFSWKKHSYLSVVVWKFEHVTHVLLFTWQKIL
jgi:hypothetical protein